MNNISGEEHNNTDDSRDLRSRRPLHNGRLPSSTSQDLTESDEDAKPHEYTKLKCNRESPKTATFGTSLSKRTSLAILFCAFLMAATILYATYAYFPKLKEEEKAHIKLPTCIEDAKQLGMVLTKHRTQYYFQVVSAFALTYIFLQTFAIPGSIFLSILSGYLFPSYTALLIVCSCSAIGATCCYGLTYLVGKGIVIKYFPERVKSWSEQVDHHREHLLNYIIFLRITPFLPNWFINVCSPVINVDLSPFILGTFIGVGPPSFLAIQTGTTLYDMTESTSNFTWSRVLFLAVLAILSLLPVLFKKKLRSRLE